MLVAVTTDVHEEAQRLIEEAIFMGQMTLSTGKVMALDTLMLLNLAKDVAKQAPKSQKFRQGLDSGRKPKVTSD